MINGLDSLKIRVLSDFYSDAILRGGAAYLINNNLQIDASISTILKIHQRCFMEVLDSLGAMMATTKKCESIQAVIMPNKKK
jgi:hypothetical protein